MVPSDETPTGRLTLAALLTECVRLDASDLHLAPGLVPYFRVNGLLEPREHLPRCSVKDIDALAAELVGGFDRSPLERQGSLDGAVSSAEGARFRFNVFRSQGKLAIALRLLENRFRSLAELGLPDSLHQLCEMPDGLIVVCGPTGAGKSTTLATMIDRINQTRRCHIVTIEDPIEYLHVPALSFINQRQIGNDASSFNHALVASLRQDPDVILVGEIRDLATIRTAITAAETGHLVLTTVHAGDCVGAIERLVSVFPADEQLGVRRQLSLVLRAVMAQHLVPADGGHAPGSRTLANGTQRRSRVPTCEILIVNPAVANLIATAKSTQVYSAMETGTAQGMQTLEQDLARLWVANLISETTAVALARNPQVLRDRAAMLRRGGGRQAGAPR